MAVIRRQRWWMLLLLLMFLLSGLARDGSVYAAEPSIVLKTFGEMTQEEKERVLASLQEEGTVPDRIRLGSGSYALNEALWYDRGLIAYGNTAAVNAAVQTTGSSNYKDGMYRYWGYDVNGGLYGNDEFPRDSDTGTLPWRKDWLTTSEIRSDPIARSYVGAFAMNTDFGESEKKTTAEAFLEENPQWTLQGWDANDILNHFYFNAVVTESGLTQGQFVGVHLSRYDGRLYYQTFSLSVTMRQYIIPETLPAPEPEPAVVPEPSVGVTCLLGLPAYTYEGHPVAADDLSTFLVGDTAYSAKRAYEEQLADNRFSIVEAGSNLITRLSSTRAEAVFSDTGRYHVKLTVTPNGRSSLSDTKAIDVRPTPSISHSLTGVQKQNRKQTINLRVATHPDYPLTELWVQIDDLDTGEEVTLNHVFGRQVNTLVNSNRIKTRPIQLLPSDSYFLNLELPFLIKNESPANLRYTIYVRDSRGKEDLVTVDFAVAVDLPPQPSIEMESYFLRGPSSNQAEILVEDGTTTDGDQSEAVWYYRSTEGEPWRSAESLPGYEDFSFGTGKAIGFLKEGVGPFLVRLDVKDVWTEETLSEYVTEADRKTGTATSQAEVINVAPTVSLKAIPQQTAELLLLAGSSAEYEQIHSHLGLLQQDLIRQGIDGRIRLEKLTPRPDSATSKPAVPLFSVNTPFGYNGGATFYEGDNFLVDEERLYKIDATWVGASETFYPQSPYTISCFEPVTGKTLWTYTFSSGFFSVPEQGTYFAQDDDGRFLFLVAGGKTLVLNKQNGSCLAKLDTALNTETYVEEHTIYTFQSDGIYGISTTNGRIKQVFKGTIKGETRRVGGRVHFLLADGLTLYRGLFDPSDETIRLQRMPGNEADDGRTSYEMAGIDGLGRLIITSLCPISGGYTKGTRVYDTNNRLLFQTSKQDTGSSTFTVTPIYNEGGECHYIAYTWESRGSSSYSVTAAVYGVFDSYAGEVSVSDPNGYPSVASHVIFAKERDGKVHLATGAYWTWILYTSSYGNGPTHGYPERTKSFVFNPVAHTASTGNLGDLGMSTVTLEYGKSSDAIAAVQTGNNHVGLTNGSETTVLTWNQSLLDVLRRPARKHLSGDADIQAVVLYDDTNPAALYTPSLLDTFADELVKSRGQLLLTDGTAIANGQLGESILSLSETGHNALGIEVLDGKEGLIQKTYSLEPDTTYYYEYDMQLDKGTDGDPEDLLEIGYGMEAKLPDSAVKPGGYQVTRVYLEDFNDPDRNPNFTIEDARAVEGQYRGANVYNRQGSNWKNYYFADGSSLQFEVPEGVQGVLSFDWDILMSGEQAWMANYVTIDGRVWQAFVPRSGTGHYTHPEILSSGAHTLSFFASAYGGKITEAKTWIDNLRLDLVRPVNLTGGSGILSGEVDSMALQVKNGILHGTGSFRTPPPVVAYQSLSNIQVASGAIGTVPNTVWTSTEAGSKGIRLDIPAGKTALYTLLATSSSPRLYRDTYYGSTYNWNGYSWTSYSGDRYPQSAMYNVPTDYRIHFPYLTGSQSILQNSASYRGAYGDFAGITTAIGTESNSQVDGNRFFLTGTDLYAENQTFRKQGRVAFRLPEGNHRLEGLRIYSWKNGTKVYVTDETFLSPTDLLDWQTEDAEVTIVRDVSEVEEPARLVFQKGEKIAYGIGYYDYEGDPSKRQYWRYTHTPMNDGPHPEAAVILSEDHLPTEIPGTVLDQPIERFYIDGRYTVEHWQEDNTTRPVAPDGNPLYDKTSNIESLTFYIGGSASAPWIDSIRTNPSTVKEQETYELAIQVDDGEKDVLRLTTEVYREGKLIFQDKKTGITADAEGHYSPIRLSTLPAAVAGRYEVVCTVRDDGGAGLGTHRFLVSSIGTIKGSVSHTDLWEEHRKQYNMGWFGESYNQPVSIALYRAMEVPRKRGINVFWSGEQLELRGWVGGNPTEVRVEIVGTPAYQIKLRDGNQRNANGEQLFVGTLWDGTMLSKWGLDEPEEVVVRFHALYEGGMIKTEDVPIIMDSQIDYWLLHRLW